MGVADALSGLKKAARSYRPTEFRKTGVLAVDDLYEGKGLPKGKIICFSGREGTGKSTVFLDVCRSYCDQGLETVYIDAENAVNESQLEGAGLSEHIGHGFHLVPSQTYREISDLMDAILPTRPALIVIDSITSVKPSSLNEANVEDVTPGLIARLQATFFMKFKDVLTEFGVTLVLLNQMRTKLNFRGISTEGPAGGNGIKFYSDSIFLMRKKLLHTNPGESNKKEDEIPWGADCIVEPVKNKLCAYRKTPITVVFGRGASNIEFLRTLLGRMGFLTQKGANFYITAPDLQQSMKGRQRCNEVIQDNYEYLVNLVTGEPSKMDSIPEEEDLEEVEIAEKADTPKSKKLVLE